MTSNRAESDRSDDKTSERKRDEAFNQSTGTNDADKQKSMDEKRLLTQTLRRRKTLVATMASMLARAGVVASTSVASSRHAARQSVIAAPGTALPRQATFLGGNSVRQASSVSVSSRRAVSVRPAGDAAFGGASRFSPPLIPGTAKDAPHWAFFWNIGLGKYLIASPPSSLSPTGLRVWQQCRRRGRGARGCRARPQAGRVARRES